MEGPAFKTQGSLYPGDEENERIDRSILVVSLVLLKGLLPRSKYAPEVIERMRLRIDSLIERVKP